MMASCMEVVGCDNYSRYENSCQIPRVFPARNAIPSHYKMPYDKGSRLKDDFASYATPCLPSLLLTSEPQMELRCSLHSCPSQLKRLSRA